VKRNSLQPYVWMLTGSFAFSWMVILANLAGNGAPWQVIALVRALVPLILVAVWARASGVRLVLWGPPLLWTRSIAGSLSLIGTFYALTRMTPSEVSTLTSIFPIWVALLSWPMLGQFPSPVVWLSVLSGVAGVALVQQPGLDGFNPVALVVVAVSVFSAVAMMGLNRLSHLDPRAIVVHFSGVAAVFSVAALFVWPITPGDQALELWHVLALLGVGVTATIGQFFLTKAFTAGVPARVSVVSLTQVVFVLILDGILLGHVPQAEQLLGVLLIIGPSAWMMVRKTRGVRVLRPRPESTSYCAAVASAETSGSMRISSK
jgi:drug/metabolite transporter (DMT)-like permease